MPIPLSPGGQVSEASKPKSPAVPKFQSPKQLLTSWLKTNSRKRTHSDSNNSDNKTDNDIKSVKPESSSELTLKVDNASQNVEFSSQNNQTQKHGTNDTKEIFFHGQKSPTVSPLKKRLCVDNPLNSAAPGQERGHAKPNPNPGKENLALVSSDCSSCQNKQPTKKVTSITNSIETFRARSNKQVATKSFTPTQTQNWLTEWSAYCKAKYGDKSNNLHSENSENGNGSTSSEKLVATINVADDSSADNLQAVGAQVS